MVVVAICSCTCHVEDDGLGGWNTFGKWSSVLWICACAAGLYWHN